MFRRFQKLPIDTRIQLAFYGTAGACTVMMCGFALPHTMLLSKYKEFMTCYSSGVERPLPDKILRRFHTACDILKVTDLQRTYLKPFTVFGQDLFHAGTTKSRFGALIGIPANYGYDQVGQIDRSAILIKTARVDWNTKEGKLLENALVLTEDEQVFGIAREILMSTSIQPGLNVIYPAWTTFIIYGLGRFFNDKLALLYRPMQIRVVLYIILSLFGYGVWALLKDGTQHYYERLADETLASLGPELISAGVRFYEKLLDKNIAIRGLSQDTSVYTSKGDLTFLFRKRCIPLTERKEYFEAKLKDESGKETTHSTNNEG